MKRKAEFQGECQVCGHTQKLPNGMLAQHGYTKRWGFFEGTCYGSSNLPFEQSKALVEQAIARAQNQKTSLELQASKRESVNDPTDVVDHCYINSLGRHSGYYHCSGKVEQRPSIVIEGRQLYNYYFVGTFGSTPVEHKLSLYGDYSLEAAAKQLNQTWANRLRRQVKEIDDYISWQRQRIQTWKQKPLKPVNG